MADKHLYIFGEIGWENNVQSVAAQLAGTSKDDNIVVHIHSPGGDVNEGFAIYDHILSYGATVETRIEGLCASIATIIALAGSKRTITENSNFFVHNPWTFTEGDADTLLETADQLKAVEEKIASFYSQRTGKDKEYMLQLMKDAKDISPLTAQELGFVSEVVKPVLAMASYKINHQSISTQIENKIESTMSKFLNEMRKVFNLEPKAEIKNLETTLEDGTAITIEGEEVIVGAAVTVSGEPAPDGGHTLADGTGIVTVDGVITDVMIPGEEETETVDSLKAKLAEAETTIANLTSEAETLKASVTEHEQVLAEIKAKFEQKQPIFNRAPRTSAPKAGDKKANRFGSAAEIKAKLETKKSK